MPATPDASMITFAVMGIVQVFAGVLILTGIAPRAATWVIEKSFLAKRVGPVAKVSLAHPAAAPMRTAVIMGMFSLTVFSVIVLAGYSVQFEEHSSGYVDDASGEFEILLSSSRQAPLELSSNPEEWGLKDTNPEDIDAVGIVNRAVVWVDDGEDSIGYILRGVDSGFIEHGAIPLEDWDSNPFIPTESGNLLVGRGAADMKGSVAAFVTSIEAFLEKKSKLRSFFEKDFF